MQAEGNYYVIGHITLFTGLSDRTVRNHIASGFLQGEKIDGVWHFSPEQVEAYICHPAVRPGILAKNNSLIYDFLLQTKKTERESCTVLDLPGADREAVSEFFCRSICEGDYKNIRFAFDGVGKVCRVILTGSHKEVLRLVNEFEKRGI